MTFNNKRESCFYAYSCGEDKCSSCQEYEEVDLDEGYYGTRHWKEMREIKHGITEK